MFKRIILFIAVGFLTLIFKVVAQEEVEKENVMQTIDQLFDGMRSADSAMVGEVFYKTTRLSTVYVKDGNPILHEGELDGFLSAIGTPHEEIYDERIWDPIIQIDGNLATVWVNYAFYVGEKFSHCGVNTFQMFKSEEGWKIVNLIDTRYKDGCREP